LQLKTAYVRDEESVRATSETSPTFDPRAMLTVICIDDFKNAVCTATRVCLTHQELCFDKLQARGAGPEHVTDTSPPHHLLLFPRHPMIQPPNYRFHASISSRPVSQRCGINYSHLHHVEPDLGTLALEPPTRTIGCAEPLGSLPPICA
jgi:hypothetical protein